MIEKARRLTGEEVDWFKQMLIEESIVEQVELMRKILDKRVLDTIKLTQEQNDKKVEEMNKEIRMAMSLRRWGVGINNDDLYERIDEIFKEKKQ